MSKTTKEEIINKISKDLMLRKDVVEDVINQYTNVMIEEIVNKGSFQIMNVFSISSAEWKSYLLDGKTINPHKRLKVRLSSRLKKLYKNFGPDSNNYGILDRNNWVELDVNNQHLEMQPSREKIENYNPLLDDEE